MNEDLLLRYKREDIITSKIEINKKKYNYKLFDTNELITLIKHDKEFIKLLEDTIKIYRKNENFRILDLIREHIDDKLENDILYLIIYKKNIIINTCRFHYNLQKKYANFSLVYTNPDYRGHTICQNSIKYLINCSKKYITKYELSVLATNIPAIRCYENIGFIKIKESIYNNNLEYYLMQIKL